MVNQLRFLKEKFGIFYYFYFGLIFIAFGSLVVFLGELFFKDIIRDTFRWTGFTITLPGGYYFIKFFISEAEEWFSFVPLLIKGVTFLSVGIIFWRLADQLNKGVFSPLFFLLIGIILTTAGFIHATRSIIEKFPFFVLINSILDLLDKRKTKEAQNKSLFYQVLITILALIETLLFILIFKSFNL